MGLDVINDGSMVINDVPSSTYRGIGGDWFNGSNIAAEDWQRNEISQNNQLIRDIYFQDRANEFNAEQAQIQRDWEEEMSNTAVQRAVKDMQIAGINPVLAVSHGGASTPSGGTATSGGNRSSGGYKGNGRQDPLSGIIQGAIQVVGGYLTKNVGTMVKGVDTINRHL